jgi:hypothetical protein
MGGLPKEQTARHCSKMKTKNMGADFATIAKAFQESPHGRAGNNRHKMQEMVRKNRPCQADLVPAAKRGATTAVHEMVGDVKKKVEIQKLHATYAGHWRAGGVPVAHCEQRHFNNICKGREAAPKTRVVL